MAVSPCGYALLLITLCLAMLMAYVARTVAPFCSARRRPWAALRHILGISIFVAVFACVLWLGSRAQTIDHSYQSLGPASSTAGRWGEGPAMRCKACTACTLRVGVISDPFPVQGSLAAFPNVHSAVRGTFQWPPVQPVTNTLPAWPSTPPCLGYPWGLQSHLLRVGEARNPGPSAGGMRSIGTINVTSLWGALHSFKALNMDIIAFQEHSLAKGFEVPALRTLAAEGFATVVSPTDPEASTPTGGVGIAVKRPLACLECKPITPEFAEAKSLGRACMVLTSAGPCTPILVGAFYGWPCSSKDKAKQARTDALIRALILESKAWPDLPCILLGDLNSESPADIDALRGALQASEWHDLGAKCQPWNVAPCMPTARAHNTSRFTRLDYILCNNHALPHVGSFRHHGFGKFDVHAMLSVGIRSAPPPEPVRLLKAYKPVPLEGVDETHIQSAIDSAFESRSHVLERHLADKDLTLLFREWSACFERGLHQASPEPPASRGRGTPVVQCSPRHGQGLCSSTKMTPMPSCSMHQSMASCS